MPKKPKKKLDRKKKLAIDFFTKVDYEGGIAEFFTSYCDLESAQEEYELPEYVIDAAAQFVSAHEVLTDALEHMKDDLNITEKDIYEYDS